MNKIPNTAGMAAQKVSLTETNNTVVYKETTRPKKPKRRDKSDLGPDFVAPDGGWGWVVCLAAGLSNMSLFPALQQYGFIYSGRMAKLGFDAKQITTIVNAVMAVSSLVGIINGVMFRRFTFRQVAIVGSILGFVGITLSAFCESFVQYLICFSCIYGIGLGLCMVSSALAVNTYFKKNRRKATGLSWTLTGLGPIIFPHISTALLPIYGAQGTILIYAGLALNAFVCALTLQPVLWHVRDPEAEKTTEANGNTIQNNTTTEKDQQQVFECKYCQYQKKEKRSIFSSQYLFNDDDPDKPGYEITEPATPMLARANDGWYGSKISLASEKVPRYRNLNRQHSRRDGGESGQNQHPEESALFKPNNFNREKEEVDRYASKTSIYSKTGADKCHCTCAEDKALLQTTTKKEEDELLQAALDEDERIKSQMTFWQKVVRFFDLNLLKDFTFVNLALGMTIMMFGEMNFSVLTPFILNSFGYTNERISLAMSLLGGVDISVRFLAPFALAEVKLDNRVLFAFGIISISIGRLIVTLTDSYYVVLAVFALIGFGKGFRTIFSSLIIPSYVPLNRLPAASGLQLIFNSMFSFAFGPVLGAFTDAFGYKITIHFINTFTCMALLLWLGESMVRRYLRKKNSATTT